MSERLQSLRACSRQQLGESRIAGEVATHHQGIDEEADETLEILAAAIGDGRADDDIGLARVTTQQHVERRQQRHVQRRSLLSAERAQCRR